MALTTNGVDQFGKTYVGRHTAIFSDSVQESSVVKVSLDVSTISTLNWAVGSAGYIVLAWEGTPNSTYAVLSGNGRWELGKGAFKKPATSTGKLLVSTIGFVSGDTYTIVLQGTLS